MPHSSTDGSINANIADIRPAVAPDKPRRKYELAVLGALLLFAGTTILGMFMFQGAALLGAGLASSEAMLVLSFPGLDDMTLSRGEFLATAAGILAGGLAITMGLLAGSTATAARAEIPWRQTLPYWLGACALLLLAAAAGGALLGAEAAVQLGILMAALFALTMTASYALGLRRSPLEFGMLKARAGWRLTLGAVLGIWLITFAAASGINWLVGLLGLEALQPSRVESQDDVLSIVALTVAAVIAAPLTEEFVFRGMLLKRLGNSLTGEFVFRGMLLKRLGTPLTGEFVFRGTLLKRLGKRMPVAAAVVISSALFSLVHFNLGAAIALFVLSLGMSAAYLLLGLRASVAMHGLHNAAVLLATVLLPEELLNFGT